jgi:ribosomal protein L34E
MVAPWQRRLKKKFKKSASGSKPERYSEKKSITKCPITGKKLSGVPNTTKAGLSKKSKTEKRPSVPFGGILSGKARQEVFIELGKVVAGIKEINDVDFKYRGYVKQVLNRAKQN